MYYALDRQAGSGRSVFINAMLHEEFIEGDANVAMEYAWNFAAPPALLARLPDELVLISTDRKYTFCQ